MTAFATPLELETHIGGEDSTPHPRGSEMLEAAAGLMQRFTGQKLHLVENDVVALYIRSGAVRLFLPERPVRNVDSLLIDAVDPGSWTWTRSGLIERDISLGWGAWPRKTAVVTYDHGFTAADPEYETLKLVNLQVAARAMTYFRNPAFEEQGGAPSETAGFAPELFLTRSEQNALFDLGNVPVG